MIEYSTEGPIGRLTLASPPSNSLDSPVFAGIEELTTFLSGPGLKGVIVMGQGRHFSGGADRSALRSATGNPGALAADLDRGKELLDALSFATVPVVAAIRGQCLGAGLEIALACHFRIAAGSALFGFPETTLGLLPGLGGTQADPGRLGRRSLVELILSGRMVGAEEALELGLVDEVVPVPEVEAATLRRIETLVGNKPPTLVRAVMESIHNGRRMPRDAALKRETELFCEMARISTEDDE